MTQRDGDRLVALKKAKRKLITQREAAEEIGQTERHVRRLLVKLRKKGDPAVLQALRGQASNQDSVPFLETLSKDPDPEVAAEGIRSLRTLRARLP